VSDAKTVSMSQTGDPGFKLTLREARIADSAHFEAALDIRDAKTLRLQVLKDDLQPTLAANREMQSLFDLALVPGEPPRLWIDLISAVIMEPNPRTYRLIQDTQNGRDIVHETENRAEMVDKIKQHMAHHLIARERRLAATPALRATVQGHSSAALILAWLSGFSIGVLALFIVGIVLDKANW
jgi:hypothetical protein